MSNIPEFCLRNSLMVPIRPCVNTIINVDIHVYFNVRGSLVLIIIMIAFPPQSLPSGWDQPHSRPGSYTSTTPRSASLVSSAGLLLPRSHGTSTG